MARQKKIYTEAEVMAMTESKMQKLFNDGRIDDDMWQRWYDNQESNRILVEDAIAEVSDTKDTDTTNTQGVVNPIDNEYEEEISKMERANRVTVETTEQGYVAHFYRTHKHIADIEVNTDGVHSNDAREKAREFAIGQCGVNGFYFDPEKQVQAWDRKYNTYMTNEEIAEDTLTLVTPAIERLVEKCKYDTEVVGIEVATISPKESNLSYVEGGRYTKSGAWCCADIEVIVSVKSSYFEDTLDIRYNVELKSGQICKPKTTILEWNLITLNEITLNGIELPVEEEVA